MEHVDVLIVGAGLSGVLAAHHLKTRCPTRTFAVLEARDDLGGTWDLFRYPGIRSDSDMFTLGYRHKPWRGAKSIAAGADILAYIREAAREDGTDTLIRYRHRVRRAAWSSREARWTVDIEQGAEKTPSRLSCAVLLMCGGYYRYDAGFTPTLPGRERFSGPVVHPQAWAADTPYAGKRVVVIGSGATAVTLVPELAKTAAHVVMLQRSPTYVVPWPDVDPIAAKLRTRVSPARAYRWTRAKNVLRGMYFYRAARRNPEAAKARMLGFVRQSLPAGYDVDRHFTPHYKPWDQRVCLAPNGDIFRAIREGRCEVVTDHITTLTEDGITLASGRQLVADLIVTATGLELQFAGGVELSVDGRPVEPCATMAYKGFMFRDVPNYATVFGYTNASWTLKADLVLDYFCRVLNLMERRGYTRFVPVSNDPTLEARPWVDFTSGYFQRAKDRMPQQGSKRPWRLYQNYLMDKIMLQYGRIEDGVLRFDATPAESLGLPTVSVPAA